jgi:hypothetical protein
LAVTVAAAFRVKVQLVVLLLPLEQPPDHSAVFPLETVSVIAVPEAKEACVELPTATLIPAGLEVMLWPVRPVADTVRPTLVTGGAAGFTVSGASCVIPPAMAKTVIPVDVVTVEVGTEKLPVVSPAGTVAVAGTMAIGLLLDKVTVNPPAGAGFVSPRIARAAVPPVTTFGKNPMLDSAAGPGAGRTVIVAVFEELL